MPLFGRPNVKRLKTKGDIEGLISALSYNKDSNVRQAASMALVEMGNHAVPSIADVLKQPDRDLRMLGARILGKIGTTQAKEFLIQALEDEDSKAREEVVQALGTFLDEQLSGYLIQALEDKDWRVRNKSALALDKLSWEPISDRDRAYYWIAKEMWAELELLGKSAVEPLIEALDLYNCTPHYVTLALGRIGDPRAIPALIRQLGKDMEISLRMAGTSFQGRILISAAQALTLMGEPAIRPLIQALGVDDPPTRAGAALALTGFGERAVAQLTQALKSDNKLIRASATELLEQITTKEGNV